MDEMILLLDNESLSENDGISIGKSIGNFFNSFGSTTEKARRIYYNNLGTNGKQNFLRAVCMSAFELAASYEPEACIKDERKLASQIFAYRNIDWFKNLFFNITGFVPSFNFCERIYYEDINEPEIKNVFQSNGCAWLLGYLRSWIAEHSTIKQSFFGGTVNGILIREYPDVRFIKNNEYGITFPYI